MGANPPTAPDRPPGQRRLDQPPDRRPALPLAAHGQLAPVPVLSQAWGSRPPPATRRDRPRRHANASTRRRRKRDSSLSRSLHGTAARPGSALAQFDQEAQRFVALPSASRRAWLAGHLTALRAGRIT